HTPGTADVLPLIVERIKGKATILMDGGIRTGFDVLKALALGAQGVLMGRDIIRSAVGGGTEGVTRLLVHTQKTLAKAMKLTGNGTINEITDRIIYKQF
ncbi:MAG: alpha-hydroxy-acid oxidizing protein, partial [Candidatus Heimdallarchaeota archaeon]